MLRGLYSFCEDEYDLLSTLIGSLSTAKGPGVGKESNDPERCTVTFSN